MFFWNSLAFLMIQQMLAIWSLVPLPFLNSAWTSGSSWFTYCWSLAWRNFERYFTSVWDECNCAVVWAFFGIAFLRDWNENWSFLLSSIGTPQIQGRKLKIIILQGCNVSAIPGSNKCSYCKESYTVKWKNTQSTSTRGHTKSRSTWGTLSSLWIWKLLFHIRK